MIGSIKGLVNEVLLLFIQAAVEGELKTRGNAEKFKGSYQEIIKGFNETLDVGGGGYENRER
ncbi:MAG: hypothetical protein AB1426_05580 [Bacillota bacterium]